MRTVVRIWTLLCADRGWAEGAFRLFVALVLAGNAMVVAALFMALEP